MLAVYAAVQKFAKSKVELEREDELTLDEQIESECASTRASLSCERRTRPEAVLALSTAA